jgi:MFS transporter, PAT family, beta-lactamase induction signal transducer AmpG
MAAAPGGGATPAPARLSTAKSLRNALTSWRIGSVTLLSFSSGLPLGLVLTALPFWMQQEGVDIKTIGVLTAAQLPYSFKFLWSPLMDRFAPRGARKRAWIAVGQVLLAGCGVALALQAGSPVVALVGLFTLLLAFASATQDIAVDAYAVEVLRPSEQGVAVGGRIAMYRAAMFVSGAFVVTLGPKLGWRPVLLALAGLFLLLVGITAAAPEPDRPPSAPTSLKDAVWAPFLGFFRHPRALEIAAFLFLYKLADNLAGALVRPFLGELGFDSVDVGVASGTVGLIATLVGTFLGGLWTTSLGVGRALWVFGVLQAVSNLGYAVLAEAGPNRPLMYAAMAIEAGTTGMGTGAFSVLLLRLTQRRFSATQYALFSSIFALGRTVSGPPAGAMVDAIGWRDFYLLTVLTAIPGMVMLQRFAPWRQREIPEDPLEHLPDQVGGRPLSWAGLGLRAALGGLLGAAVGLLAIATLAALKSSRQGGTFDLGGALGAVLSPQRAMDYVDLAGAAILGGVSALSVAGYLAARRAAGREAT